MTCSLRTLYLDEVYACVMSEMQRTCWSHSFIPYCISHNECNVLRPWVWPITVKVESETLSFHPNSLSFESCRCMGRNCSDRLSRSPRWRKVSLPLLFSLFLYLSYNRSLALGTGTRKNKCISFVLHLET